MANSILRLAKRSIETALKLPFAMAWDVFSLGNMGEGSSTGKVLREHTFRKQMDIVSEILKQGGDH